MRPPREATIATPRLWEVARYTPEIPHPCPPGYGTAFAETCAHERRHGGNLMWVVERKDQGAVIGASGLFFATDQRAADFGFVYGPDAWGRGYATEGARALVAFAFERLGLDALNAYTALENGASARVLAKVGLRRIGHEREWAPARGCFFNWEAHCVARQEWQT
jgi:ribosomal-protein-alanine N-acetyltransferase